MDEEEEEAEVEETSSFPHFHAPLVFGYGVLGLDALSFSLVSSCVFCRIAVVAALAVVLTVAYAVWFGWSPCVWQHCLVRQWILVQTSSTVVFFVPFIWQSLVRCWSCLRCAGLWFSGR